MVISAIFVLTAVAAGECQGWDMLTVKSGSDFETLNTLEMLQSALNTVFPCVETIPQKRPLLVYNFRAWWWPLKRREPPSEVFRPNGRLFVNASYVPEEKRARGISLKQTRGLYRQWVTMIEKLRIAKQNGARIFIFDASEENCIPGLHQWYAAEESDAVFRQYYCKDIDYTCGSGPTIVTLPLGIHPKHNKEWDRNLQPPKASVRPQVLAYLGSLTHSSRSKMAEFVSSLSLAFASGEGVTMALGPQVVHTGTAYQKVLWNATFCPAPRGHAVETFRLSEAFETGCIPIIDSPEHLEHTWPGISCHAILSDKTWSTALGPKKPLVDHILSLFENKTLLDAMQQRMSKWYSKTKQNVATKIITTLRG
jgi:hypothetical protein